MIRSEDDAETEQKLDALLSDIRTRVLENKSAPWRGGQARREANWDLRVAAAKVWQLAHPELVEDQKEKEAGVFDVYETVIPNPPDNPFSHF